jgi:hypothetical protein
MVDCSQAQFELDDTKQERQAMNLRTYCLDQCDPGDYVCIKQCEMSLPARKQALDQVIADLENQMGFCGTWSLDVQGVLEVGGHYVGSLTFTGIAPVSGTLDLSDSHGNSLFKGDYNPEQMTVWLLRDPDPHDACDAGQEYTGSVDFSAQPPTMQGSMGDTLRPGCVGIGARYKWSAQKQS